MIGQGPVFVDKYTGDIFETGSAYSVEHYVKAYVACGSTFAELTEKVEVSGWGEGAFIVQGG